MIAVIARIVAGPLFRYLEARATQQISQAELEAEIEKALSAERTALAAEQAKIVALEITGEDWLQRNWRPIVALSAFFSYWFVIFPYPFLVTLGLLPFVRFGEVGLQNFFILTTICVGGYIGARTIEKLKR